MTRMSDFVEADPIFGAIGEWRGDARDAAFGAVTSSLLKRSLREPVSIVHDSSRRLRGLALGRGAAGSAAFPQMGVLAPLYPEWLGDRRFLDIHAMRFAYVGGSMARGIASTDLAIALAEIGALGMFGAAGLRLAEVEAAIDRMSAALDPRGLPWGCNLIHSPGEPDLEEQLVDLYLRRNVRRVEASAFMRLSKAVVRYACTGLTEGPDGAPVRARHLFAKVSREEVAEPFLSPPPEAMLSALQAESALTAQEAALARRLPVADHVIVESDSGGHTDNRPLGALFPVIAGLRDRLVRQHGFAHAPHIGAAGGLGAPQSVAAAFAMGAAFVVIGSVHQAAVESGVSDDARAMLAQAGPADVGMTASADMFEMGVKVQVLTRGAMMAQRGNHLYQLYRAHASIDDIPASVRARLEADVFRMPIEEIWRRTEAFFSHDPAQLSRAATDPKHRMALIFRWYLGNSSRWPITGDSDRRADYQLWCGPAMGAFNRWAAGSFLEAPGARTVQQIALNLMEGAAAVTRAHQLRTYGLDVSSEAFDYRPERLCP
jgi:trans-AT polyketide synthase/acyltransferase/oxidoreductase domain-containing protein